jgi:hypothetical protein
MSLQDPESHVAELVSGVTDDGDHQTQTIDWTGGENWQRAPAVIAEAGYTGPLVGAFEKFEQLLSQPRQAPVGVRSNKVLWIALGGLVVLWIFLRLRK